MPGAQPSTGEELWVIQKPTGEAPEAADKDAPGSGELRAKLGDQEEIPLPLKHTEVQAAIAGYIAAVDVTQQYHNPYAEKIEAVYVFPLPHNAAINEFIMTIGERRIRGIIREREEAEKIYREARQQGYVASLLTQERPNIFTQSVANIEPGKQIDINIKYFHTLTYDDGWYEFVFPMVVGPRFNPPGGVAQASPRVSDGVGALSRGQPGRSGQKTEVQYLKGGTGVSPVESERSGHDIGLTVRIDAGVNIEKIECRNHVVAVSSVDQPIGNSVAGDTAEGGHATKTGDTAEGGRATNGDTAEGGRATKATKAIVKLSDLDAIPNKDFVLRYKVAGQRIKSALMTQWSSRPRLDTTRPGAAVPQHTRPEAAVPQGFFTLMLYPPETLRSLERAPMEMIFVLDCSGSMSGQPIAQAKAAVERALQRMRPDDTFQLISFSISASQLGPKPVSATPENIRRGLGYLRALQGEGGTMMIEGIKAALDFPHDPQRLRTVAFLTDGYIGNEAEILAAVHQRLGASRIFSFGVGSSPNRYLLDHMAKLGRGAVAYLSLHDNAGDVMDAYFERVSHPALTDLAIDWGSLGVSDVYPQRVPDLFVGRPVLLTGRYAGQQPTTIRITGHAGEHAEQITLNFDPTDGSAAHAGLPAVWARMKIADLGDRSLYEHGTDWPGEIKRVALEFGLMSAYTAFVAVDSTVKTAGDHGVTVVQPVPVPEGVRYDTTVSEGQPTAKQTTDRD